MHGRVHETPVETFEEQLRLNLRPGYLVCAAALPALLEAAGGAIVCVSSRAALQPFAGAAGYVVSKAAVLAFVDAWTPSTARTGSAPTPCSPASSTRPPIARRCPTRTSTRGCAPRRSRA
jgi:NAD(P)-dependent dehydrogenase (short-subunit alcohol dehydrogenase family)